MVTALLKLVGAPIDLRSGALRFSWYDAGLHNGSKDGALARWLLVKVPKLWVQVASDEPCGNLLVKVKLGKFSLWDPIFPLCRMLSNFAVVWWNKSNKDYVIQTPLARKMILFNIFGKLYSINRSWSSTSAVAIESPSKPSNHGSDLQHRGFRKGPTLTNPRGATETGWRGY